MAGMGSLSFPLKKPRIQRTWSVLFTRKPETKLNFWGIISTYIYIYNYIYIYPSSTLRMVLRSAPHAFRSLKERWEDHLKETWDTISGLWFGTFRLFFPHIYILILGRIIPTDFLIFFRGVGQPPSCPTDWIILDSKAGPLPWADQDPVASLLPRWRWAEEGFSKSPFDLDDDDSGTVGTMGKPWENHRKMVV